MREVILEFRFQRRMLAIIGILMAANLGISMRLCAMLSEIIGKLP